MHAEGVGCLLLEVCCLLLSQLGKPMEDGCAGQRRRALAQSLFVLYRAASAAHLGGPRAAHEASWFGERDQKGAACAHRGVPVVRWVPGNPWVGWQSSLLSCWGEIHF